jgi:cobaltochelatase CobS
MSMTIPFNDYANAQAGMCDGYNTYLEFSDYLQLGATTEEEAYDAVHKFMPMPDAEPEPMPAPEPKPKPKKLTTVNNGGSDAIQVLANALNPYLNIPAPDVQIDEGRVIELIKDYAPVKHIEIKTADKTTVVSGVQHCEFEPVLQRVSAGMQMYLVGPMGTGKTKMAELIAESLSLPFYSISVCAQTSEVKFFGYMTATGEYCSTLFRQAYEHGGVFLVDEIDNGNPNVLAALNAALAGTVCAFPDGMVQRHPDFRCMAAGNTFGMGASAQYVGRVKLDESTLDRFQRREIDYDTKLEAALFGQELVDRIVALREKYANERVGISMRAYERVIKLMQIGLSMDEAINEGVISNIPHNLRKK